MVGVGNLGRIAMKASAAIPQGSSINIVIDNIDNVVRIGDPKDIAKTIQRIDQDILKNIDIKKVPNFHHFINNLSPTQLKTITKEMLDDLPSITDEAGKVIDTGINGLEPNIIKILIDNGNGALTAKHMENFTEHTIGRLDVVLFINIFKKNSDFLSGLQNPILRQIGLDMKNIRKNIITRNLKGIDDKLVVSPVLKRMITSHNSNIVKGTLGIDTWAKFIKSFPNWKTLLAIGVGVPLISKAFIKSRGNDKAFFELIGEGMGDIFGDVAKGAKQTATGITNTIPKDLNPFEFLKNMFSNMSNVIRVIVFIIIMYFLYNFLK